MTRLSLSIAAALAVTAAGFVPAAQAAPGDGIAKACVASFDASAKRRGKPGPYHPHREALCGCLEKRIKADGNIDGPTKDKVAEIFTTMATDRAKARKMQRDLGPTNRLVGGHANACTKQVVPQKKPEGEKKPN